MARVEMNPDLIEIDGKVRIERGPARKTAVATEELLSDTVTHPGYHAGGFDAGGNVIVLGEPMVYIDFLGERGWYVYKLLPAPDADDIVIEHWPDVIDGVPHRWMPQGYFVTVEEAEAFATTLL